MSNAFHSCFWRTACWVQPDGDVNFISRPSQKFLFGNSAVLQILQILYNLPLSAASAAALNDHGIYLFL